MNDYKEIKVEKGKHLIGGEWMPSIKGKTIKVVNPATEKILTEVSHGGSQDIDAAVSSARAAFENKAWRLMPPRERGRLMYKLADLIEKNQERLAILETMDNGKQISETMAFDLPQVIETFRYYAGWADKIYGDVNPISNDYLSYTLKEPVGVVGQIIPWNFPLLMAAWKLGPAMATGCTTVLKPAEQTPLTAIELGKLIMDAGFPPGVVNIVTGEGDTGAVLAAHTGIDKVAFTGSTEVGRKVMATAGANLKRVSLELGGKAANIVYDDADIDQAVAGAILGIYFNQGEVCCAGSRLFLHDKIHDKFISKFKEVTETITVGNPLDKKTRLGAQVSLEQYEKIIGYIESGKKEGATLVTGGEGMRKELGGYFIKPTLFTETKQDMKICREEIFGPVLSVQKFKDTEELVERANDTEYGLSAGIWSCDVNRIHKVARRLKAGTIWTNCYNAFDVSVPFGGYKNSGFGRELGRQAIDLYTGEKAVWVKLQD